MLVVDINTLQAVNLLNLGNDIVLDCLLTLYREYVGRIYRAFRQRIARLYIVAVEHLGPIAERYSILLLRAVLRSDYRVAGLLYFLITNRSRYSGYNSHILRVAALEKLLNARQTLRDILRRSDTARMEGSHGKLRTGLAYGLRRDNSHSFALADKLSVGKRRAVALRADAVFQLTREHRAYFDIFNARFNDTRSVVVIQQLLPRNRERTVGRGEILREIASNKALRQLLNQLVALTYLVNLYSVGSTAVLVADNYLL